MTKSKSMIYGYVKIYVYVYVYIYIYIYSCGDKAISMPPVYARSPDIYI